MGSELCTNKSAGTLGWCLKAPNHREDYPAEIVEFLSFSLASNAVPFSNANSKSKGSNADEQKSDARGI